MEDNRSTKDQMEVTMTIIAGTQRSFAKLHAGERLPPRGQKLEDKPDIPELSHLLTITVHDTVIPLEESEALGIIGQIIAQLQARKIGVV
jgi:hypothetical protein